MRVSRHARLAATGGRQCFACGQSMDVHARKANQPWPVTHNPNATHTTNASTYLHKQHPSNSSGERFELASLHKHSPTAPVQLKSPEVAANIHWTAQNNMSREAELSFRRCCHNCVKTAAYDGRQASATEP